MLYIDIPYREEFLHLSEVRSDACVSIYLETSPLREELDKSVIQLGNAIKEALDQLQKAGFDKRRLALLSDELYEVLEDESFWRLHARTLAILATPDNIRTYRLPNQLPFMVKVSDRFHLKPLLRAILFPNAAYILALSENQARLVEFFPGVPPAEVQLENMPADAASAVGRTSITSRAYQSRVLGAEGRKPLLARYTRMIDQALRPLLAAQDYPLFLAATEPLASIYRSTNSLDNLNDQVLSTSPEHMNEAELVQQVRPLLDNYYKTDLEDLYKLIKRREGERRVAYDAADCAKAATRGAVDTLLVDMECVVHGTIDEVGHITYTDEADADTYGVIDEIVRRALQTGASIKALRSKEIPKNKSVIAVLRYPI